MGKFFADEKDVERVDLGDGAWVDIKKELSYGEYQNVVSSFADMEAGVSGRPNMKYNIARGNLMMMEKFIVAWSITDDSGNTVPVTKENITRLKRSVADTIMEVINKNNPLA
jgi:predicted ThiF/HesA family dinucleotide-utilizing enzyme